MRTSYQITAIVLLTMLTGTSIAEQAVFGRFFTSAKQRQQLDTLRAAKPDVEDEIILIDELPDDSTEMAAEDTTPLDALTVRGVVYRKNRKNTAWLNNSNTNQGDLSFGPVRVDESGIKNDRVNIELVDNDTKLILKVGETYDPHSSAISDISSNDNSQRGRSQLENEAMEQQ